jgi:hypothetical protein
MKKNSKIEYIIEKKTTMEWQFGAGEKSGEHEKNRERDKSPITYIGNV